MIKAGTGAELLGFSGDQDDQDDKFRGPRKDQGQGGKAKGGRKGRMVMNDDDFPAL